MTMLSYLACDDALDGDTDDDDDDHHHYHYDHDVMIMMPVVTLIRKKHLHGVHPELQDVHFL